MGVRKYVRDRKQVKAMRATEDGFGAFANMGRALGYERVAVTNKGATTAPYEGTNAEVAQSRGSDRWEAAGRGVGRHSDVGQPHVKVKD
jgi:hypothetical protein